MFCDLLLYFISVLCFVNHEFAVYLTLTCQKPVWVSLFLLSTKEDILRNVTKYTKQGSKTEYKITEYKNERI